MSPLSLCRFGDRYLNWFRDPAGMHKMILDNRTDPNGGYALGWNSAKDTHGIPGWLLWHGGVIAGWRCGVGARPGLASSGGMNASSDQWMIMNLAFVGVVSEQAFKDYKVPPELVPPSLQRLEERIMTSGYCDRLPDLWPACGYHDTPGTFILGR